MDQATAGVLRDVTLLVGVALLLGALAYSRLRHARPALAWNWGGQVDVRLYNVMDVVVVTATCLLLLSPLQAAEALKESSESPRLTMEPLLVNIAFLLMLCAVLLAYLVAVRGLHPAELFGLRRLSWAKAVGVSLLLMIPVWILVATAANGMSGWLEQFWPNQMAQDTVEAFQASEDPLAKTLVAFAAVLVAPLVEETVFRGLIYGVAKRYTDGYFAALCSALLFGVVHYHVGSFVPLAMLGLAFCAAYEMSGSLLVPMFMHSLFNGANLALMLLHKSPPA
jgi:membrane protease YdiL (CAAX protease family)